MSCRSSPISHSVKWGYCCWCSFSSNGCYSEQQAWFYHPHITLRHHKLLNDVLHDDGVYIWCQHCGAVGVCGRARVFACPYIHIYTKAHMLTFTPDVFLVYCWQPAVWGIHSFNDCWVYTVCVCVYQQGQQQPPNCWQNRMREGQSTEIWLKKMEETELNELTARTL